MKTKIIKIHQRGKVIKQPQLFTPPADPPQTQNVCSKFQPGKPGEVTETRAHRKRYTKSPEKTQKGGKTPIIHA